MTKRYGILHLVGPAQAPVADQVIPVARGLSPAHYEVTVAGPLSDYFRRRLSRHQVRWVNLPLPSAGSLSGYLSAARQVQRLLHSKPVDLIHAHGLSAALTALLARRRVQHQRLPVLCTVYDPLTGASTWLRRLGVRWVLGNCTKLIVQSEAERALIGSIAPRAAQAAQVVYPAVRAASGAGLYDVGVKRQLLGLRPDAALVGVLGIPGTGQAVDGFLRAAALVSDEMPNIEFAMIGAGTERPRLQALVHNLGLSGACVFLDHRRDLAEIVLALNLLVLLSDGGGTPGYGLQALAMEIPVIAVDTQALVEILGDLPSVRVVATDNVENMAVALTALLHIVPADEAEFEIVGTTGVRLRLRDVLVSQQSYDLQEKWSTSGPAPSGEPSAAEAVVSRYGVQRLVAEIESIYYQALN